MIGNHAIEDIFKGMKKLPTLPGIAMKILEAVRNEESYLKEIGDILSKDPPLSGEVLKIINSPFYGLQTKITTVPHAVNLLGINTVKNLALSFSLVKNACQKGRDSFEYSRFWKDSMIGALTAKLVAQRIVPTLQEDAFFLGLLQNIGILALCQCMPEQYCLVMKEKQASGCSDHEAENHILGFSHMDIGAHLVKSWGLPETFHIPIRYHHRPEEMKKRTPEIQILTRILHFSSLFIDFFNFPDKTFKLGILDYFAKEYGFSSKFQMEALVEQIHEQTRNVFPLFEIEMSEGESYMQMIEEARKELINVSSNFMARLLEQQKLIEQLKEQATRDGLTGLLNYQTFYGLLGKELRRAKRYGSPVSLVIADIDLFKRVNDKYGHLAGDHVLKRVAQCFEATLRETDIVARYGGEEFAIIMPATGSQGAWIGAERLRETFSSLQITYESQKIPITMSFGIASLASGRLISANDFIKIADLRLYDAKRSGRNRCCLISDRDEAWEAKNDPHPMTSSPH